MDIQQILEAIENMSVLELNDLVKEAEEKFGVSAAAPVVVGGVVAAGGEAAGAEEKSEFDVVLESAGSQKIKIIKVVKDLLGLGLKDAKELVDGAPKTLKEGVAKAEAEEMKSQLEELGATVELK